MDAASLPAVLALLIVGGMFVLFVLEVFPPDVTAIAGVAAMLAAGIILPSDLSAAFSNPAPATIAAMFILSGALTRTGTLDSLSQMALARAKTHPRTMLALMALFTVAASAFMNNTPVVMLLIPIAIKLAAQIGQTASRLLIPLSYAAILGGTCTLIGTSTNILVDGVASNHGMERFGLFEIAPLGLIHAVVGLGLITLMAPHLLPRRESLAELTSGREKQQYFTELMIPENSPLVGRKALEVEAFRKKNVRLIDVLRQKNSLRRELDALILEAGDRVVLRSSVREVLTMRESGGLAATEVGETERETETAEPKPVQQMSSSSSVTVEALVGPGCTLVGRQLGKLHIRRRYGVYPLAVHRRGENMAPRFENIRIQVGDTLLMEGAPEDISRFANEIDLTGIDTPSVRPFRPQKAPIAIGALLGVVGLAALGTLPIVSLAVIAVAVVLVFRAIDIDEAFSFVDAHLLVLILAMLAIAEGLMRTGAVDLIIMAINPLLEGASPLFLLGALYFLTALLTSMLTNNAVAVIITPLAIEMAVQAGYDPRPFVVAVMFAASASFATPLGYQTNMLVYGPGGYKFSDYMRLGVPMTLFLGLLTVYLIPQFWPFVPG